MSKGGNVVVMGGMGKVGSAISNILSDAGNTVYVIDKQITRFIEPGYGKTDFLHVTIPYSKTFIRDVKAEIKRLSPKWVVIHSTIPVGTCRKIGRNVAHSPVRGQHDDLENSLKRFFKYVAGVDRRATKAVFNHLRDAGFKVIDWEKPEDTELNKLLCLSRLLNDLAFYETAYKLQKRFKVNPDRLKEWTETYNLGYEGTKHHRSMLDYPMGVAGGTCVLPVSQMLQDQVKSDWLKRNITTFRPKSLQIERK